MRFRISEFEQHFAPADLRKGLQLLKKKSAELVARHTNHYGYQIGQHMVSFERSGQEIHHLHCDCQKRYCAHMAAAVFLQNETLVHAGSQKISRVQSHNAENFRTLFASLESLWKKITSSPQPVSSQVAAFVKRLENMTHRNGFAADMAILAGMSLCGRSSLTDERLSQLTQKIIIRNFGSNVAADEEVMYLCLTETLRTNDRALTGRFSSILPVYLLHTRNIFHVEELRALAERRNFRKYHSDLFDEILIAKAMIFFRTSELEGKNVRINKTSPPEYFIARARLFFAGHKLTEAWKVLDELRVIMREKMPLSYFDLLSYLIALCEALHDQSRKVDLAEELMLCSPYLSGSFVSGYLKSLPASKRQERSRRLMNKVASSGAEGAGDKLLILAMETGNTDLFFHSPLKRRVRFTLLHELFQKQRTLLQGAVIDFYFNRLCEALTETEFAHARAGMLQKAAGLLGQLPARKAELYHGRVLDYISARPSLRIHEQAWDNAFSVKGRQLVFE